MKTILTVLAGLLGTGLLAYLCATGHRDVIQQDLSGRTRSALSESAVSDLRVSADGRDVTLSGKVPNPREKYQAEETARKVYGVRAVTNLLEVREATAMPVPPTPPALTVTEAESTGRQPTVSPPKPAKSSGPQRMSSFQSLVVKSKPTPSQVPTKQEPLASLTSPREMRMPSVRCEDALASALGRRQIHFETNQSVIRPVSYPVLDRLAEVAKSCPAKKIDISGHTDPSGAEGRNVALSLRRAQAVIHYLVKKGVPAKRLAAVGLGSTKPVTPNTTEAGRQRNRRVEFGIKGP